MKALIACAARVCRAEAAAVTMPTTVVRALAPLGPALKPLGLPPNLREVVSASDGVTYWASDAKARAELGYVSRGLEDGMLDLYAAEHASAAPD